MGNNIRDLRNERGWSMRDLADRMETHFTTIAKIERSQRRLTADWIQRFALAFGVAASAITFDGSTGAAFAARSVPVIGMVSAGNWREAVQHADDYVATLAPGANVFGLKVEGDSMDLIAPAGTIVIVDPDQFELHDGAHYVVMNDEGDTTFKQYRSNPSRLEPCSSNPAYETIPLGRAPFTVVGKVVGIYTAFA